MNRLKLRDLNSKDLSKEPIELEKTQIGDLKGGYYICPFPPGPGPDPLPPDELGLI